MSYQPNKAIHPGLTVGRTLVSLGMTQKSLSERTGITEKHISTIINGDASITPESAALFANAIGGTPSFWSNLQANYEAIKVKIETEKQAAEEIELMKCHPYTELKQRGKVSDVRDPIQKVVELWRFYGVNSLKSVQLTEAVAWRRGASESVKAESLAAWLRCGELEAKDLEEKIEIADYDESKLKSILLQLRKYTTHDDFWNKSVRALAESGVALVGVEHFKGTRANGATRWIGNTPTIQLSIFGKDADKMWFSLMHEIGHILKHGRKNKYISFVRGKEKSAEELEADAFASEVLIPQQDYYTFVMKGDMSREAIRAFATEQGIHPGIVLGRLKINSVLDFRAYPDMHGKLTMKEN